MKRLRSWYETGYGDEILTWYWLKSTGKPCSCEGCRNVRRSGWFKKGQRLTNQEKRSDISHAEQLREYYDAKDVSA
jgi:hypothetical protein